MNFAILEYRRKRRCKKPKLENVENEKSEESKQKEMKKFEKLNFLESRKSPTAPKIESSNAIKYLKSSLILKTTKEPNEAVELIKTFGMISFFLSSFYDKKFPGEISIFDFVYKFQSFQDLCTNMYHLIC